MELLPTLSTPGLAAAALLLLTLLWVRRRKASSSTQARDAVDTVAGWPPEAARVMTVDERQAYELLRRALPPDAMILAQVPLSRFLRVPMRHSYSDWLHRAGHLSADLLVCDAGSRLMLVIDMRSAQESERSRRRHDRLARVLKAAGVPVLTWLESELPSVSELRHTIAELLASGGEPAAPVHASGPLPLIPVPDIAEVLADGDLRDFGHDDPVPSGFYDDAAIQMASARA